MEVCIGLGSNLGDREGWLRRGVEGVSAHWGPPRRWSRCYETEAWGMPPGTPAFLNQVVLWEVDGGRTGVREALAMLGEVERRAGRERPSEPTPRLNPTYLNRTLDCDLLLWGDEQWHLPELIVPHPRLTQRRFVLAPLAELVPHQVVPGDGRTVATCLACCPDPHPVTPWTPPSTP